MDERFCAFPILKPESQCDEFDGDYIDFMQTAYAEGFRPREASACTCISVGEFGTTQAADLVYRGRRNGWEPFLGDFKQSVRLGQSYKMALGDCAFVSFHHSVMPATWPWNGCAASHLRGSWRIS